MSQARAILRDVGGEPMPAVRFAETARRLGAGARAAGLATPAFRCPPRIGGVNRTIRRYPGGTVVSVAMRGRAFEDVVVDMVEGVVATNRLVGDGAQRVRTALLEAAGVAASGSETRAA